MYIPFTNITEVDGEKCIQLHGYLVIEVKDYDKVNQDDYLGRLVVPLSDITPDNSKEAWLPLTRKMAKETVSGSIGVKLGLHLEGDTVSIVRKGGRERGREGGREGEREEEREVKGRKSKEGRKGGRKRSKRKKE